jgi:soluble lytic murein transglycosylase-like protein
MRRIVLLAGLAALSASAARADYAVLRTGERLHVSSYERTGDSIRMMVAGGVLEVPADSIVAFEPEDVFVPSRPVAPAPSGTFSDIIRAAASRHGLDEKLITSVIAAESNFNPKAISRKQARGLMQLLPSTAARFDVTDIFDPAQNIEAGTRYLKQLLDQYRGNLALALAAYNAGPDVVAKFGGVPPIAETRAYVKRVQAHYNALLAAETPSLP